MRIGVVGIGVISRFYLAVLRESGPLSLGAVCDVRPEALAPYRDEVPCWSDHRDMMAAGGLDAVVVTVPNDRHAPVCRDLLDAGLPVCVEKPLAITLDDGRELATLAAARAAVLFTAFHRRYNARVRALLDGLPGDVPIESVRIRYLERIEDHVGDDRWYLDPARCGGGCVADNGPNAFDLARLFLGPLALSDAEVRRDEAGVDRQAEIRLTAASGAEAVVELDWSHEGETKDVEVRLADGTVRRADMLTGFPGFKQSLWHEYSGVLRDFARAVHVGGEDGAGLSALELVDAVYRAELSVGGR
ncbi:Gfo/Idh/MocA family protein [Actinokineospora xionganensis]|uniref:Gfo/Idh/MocA family oxidoreductase n=1 Tax=Actinokineospora xionganensis TaxID=2684470 RepID=A0ABR7LFN6_9PSEU|nr:Gfo/Idh/MocA family oxidoreductase [Actinokineospora xionganensis]MBC6451511.1 Gfo/Idh/MocA family oxidoreductase [Actinokineospora xionganensis]